MATERRDFTKEEIDYAWSIAKVAIGADKDKWRKDYAGAWIVEMPMVTSSQNLVGK